MQNLAIVLQTCVLEPKTDAFLKSQDLVPVEESRHNTFETKSEISSCREAQDLFGPTPGPSGEANPYRQIMNLYIRSSMKICVFVVYDGFVNY